MTYDPVDTNDDGVVDADVDNESVSTGDLDIDDSDVNRVWEQMDSDTITGDGTSQTLQVQTTGTPSDYRWRVDLDLRVDTDVLMTIDNSSSTNYIHYDESGSRTTGASEIPVIEIDGLGNAIVGGTVIWEINGLSGASRPGFGFIPTLGRRSVGYAPTGGFDDDAALGSVEITSTYKDGEDSQIDLLREVPV